MALFSCTKLSIGLVAVYVSYVSWTMYMLFCPAKCDKLMDPSRCIAPLHDSDSEYKVSSPHSTACVCTGRPVGCMDHHCEEWVGSVAPSDCMQCRWHACSSTCIM